MKRLKVAVFGQGFLGSHLARLLEANPQYQIVRCSRSHGVRLPGGTSPVKVSSYLDSSLYTDDLVGGSDCVIYTVGIAHSKSARSGSDFSRYERVNADLTHDVAHACHKAGVRRFIFLSSVKVYDDVQMRNLPITLSAPLSASDPYGLSKIKAERLLARVSRETGLEVVILRLPLVIGPGAKGNLFKLMQILSTGFPIPSESLKNNKRSILSVENLASAVGVCIDHPSACDRPLLLADAEPVSVAQVIDLINEGLGSPSTLWQLPPLFRWLTKILPSQLQSSLVISCEESYRQINWEPGSSTKDAVLQMARAYKAQKQNIPS